MYDWFSSFDLGALERKYKIYNIYSRQTFSISLSLILIYLNYEHQNIQIPTHLLHGTRDSFIRNRTIQSF